MKKYINILTIVTVIAIIVGSVIHLASCSQNGGIGHLSYEFSSDSGDSKKTKFGEVYDKDFSNIEISMALVEIDVKEGTVFSVDYEGKDKYKPIVKTDSNTLVITNSDREFAISSIGSQNKNKLSVTIPKGKEFDKAKIESVMSEVEIETINAKNLEIEVPTGEVRINNAKGESLKAEVVKGDLTMNADFKDLDILSTLGNVEIDLAQDVSKYNVEASSELGNIECGELKAKGATATSQNGDLGNIKIECAMGNVKID